MPQRRVCGGGQRVRLNRHLTFLADLWSFDVTAAVFYRLGGMAYTSDDLTGLGAKLDALDLTDGERAALCAIFDAATPDDDEAVGYASPLPPPRTATFSFFVNRFGSFGSSSQSVIGGTPNTTLSFDEADSLFGKRTN